MKSRFNLPEAGMEHVLSSFTDAQVIRQHGFSNDSRYETAAQIYFGLQPDLPVIVF